MARRAAALLGAALLAAGSPGRSSGHERVEIMAPGEGQVLYVPGAGMDSPPGACACAGRAVVQSGLTPYYHKSVSDCALAGR